MNKKNITDYLILGGIEPNEAKAECDLILEYTFLKTKEELIFTNDFDEKKILPILKERVETGRPIQYILKFAPFMGEKFKIDENVLIPRDETELVVKKAQTLLFDGAKVLDIGAGSGIISCMIGKYANNNGINVQILGTDISLYALEISIDNMKRFNLQGTVMFRKSDVFSNIKENEKFDIIVSNPPYIPKSYKESIQKEVLFEPDIALYTEDKDGIYFYQKIIKDAKKYLNKGGYLLFELMEGQFDKVFNLFVDNGFVEIEGIEDLSKIKRVICAKFI